MLLCMALLHSFFFFQGCLKNYLFLIDWWLVYSFSLISAIHQHELTIGVHISSSSWISLPSIITESQFEFPEFHSKFPLAIYLHSVIHYGCIVYMHPCYSLHLSHALSLLLLHFLNSIVSGAFFPSGSSDVFRYKKNFCITTWLPLSMLSGLETEGRMTSPALQDAACVWCSPEPRAHLSMCPSSPLPCLKGVTFQTHHKYCLLCRAVLIPPSKISCSVFFILLMILDI